MIKYISNHSSNIGRVSALRRNDNNKHVNKRRKYRIGVRCDSGSDIIYKKMVDKKVKDVFLISGGSIMHVVDKLYN